METETLMRLIYATLLLLLIGPAAWFAARRLGLPAVAAWLAILVALVAAYETLGPF